MNILKFICYNFCFRFISQF